MNGYLAANGDVSIRMPPRHTSRFLLVFLFFGNVWKVLPKSIPDRGPLEVLVRVQVFDNSDLSPLPDATVEAHGNQSTPSLGRAGSDGIATVTLLYRPGTWVIITASKPGYVTNSAPWHAKRIPLYASVSLYLLPQRPATLILYEDVVQVLLGSPGSRHQPWVQFQRKAIGLTLNSTYAELSAMLTAAKSQYEIGGFPYPLGQESANSTGSDGGWADLTAVAAVSAHLLDQNGTAVPVSDPVYVSIPLPSDTPVRAATSVPVWRFEAQKGLWVRNGTGYIKKEGTQMTWSFVASQLGYWMAAFPTASGMAVNSPGLGDITAYHTIFLLAILGSLALLVLVLLCVLLYHCRRRCLKPRQQHHKPQVSAPLDSSKRDQGTSTSHLHLISGGGGGGGGGRADTASACGDGDALKSELSSREEFFHKPPRVNAGTYMRRGDGFPPKPPRPGDARNQDKRRNGGTGGGGGSANDNQGYASDPPSPPPFVAAGVRYQDSRPPEYSASQPGAADPPHPARPPAPHGHAQPGQLIFCSSADQMNESMYRSVVPTLVIPAHYMRLSSDLSAVEHALDQQQQQQQRQQQDREGMQVSVTLPGPRGAPGQQGPSPQQQQQQQGQWGGPQQEEEEDEEEEEEEGGGGGGEDSVRIPVLFDDSAMSQMSEELQALTEQKLLELGVKPQPRAWFVSLDGRSNSLVRHSYIELGNERVGGGVGGGVGGPAPGRAESRDGRQPRRRDVERTAGERRGRRCAAKAHARPACANNDAGKTTGVAADGEEGSRAAPSSPEDNSLAPLLLDEAPGPRGATFPRRGPNNSSTRAADRDEARRSSATSPEAEENDLDDRDDEEGGSKKSPWQKREERPLMVFNVK